MVILVLYSYLTIYSLEVPNLHILSLACHGKNSCTASVLAIYVVPVGPLVLIQCRKVLTKNNASKKAVKMMHL